MLMNLRKEFVPKRKSSRKPTWRDSGSFPISKALQEAIRRKHLTHRRWMAGKRHGQSDRARLNYTRARNKVTKLMRQAKRNFEKDIARKCKTNPKVFWAHIRNNLKRKIGVAPLLEKIDDKTSIKFSDEDKANILQKQFSSVYTQEPEGTIARLNKKTDTSISDLHVTNEMVKEEILRMNPNKSCGPDDVHPRMLQELVNIISDPITIPRKKTIDCGNIPADWRRANVTPIYKKGAKNLAENYRPISLTSLICKLIESLIKRAIMKHLAELKLLLPKQFGFISGRSTTT